MLDKLAPYLEPILQACLVFPLIAAVFTLPFLIVNYRKYGGIAVMRVLVVYSFIFYELCALLLTILPLPSREAVAAMSPKPIGWVPFTDLNTGLVKAGLDAAVPASLISPSNWRTFFTSSDFFQIVANIVMQMPLGFYLRYYFRRSWKQTALIGLCVSLFYELTQFTGLWFLYPQAYRYATVDDLICNTLGCLLGFWCAPLLTWFLPSREEIDQVSMDKGQHVTLLRRTVAAALDWTVFGALSLGGAAAVPRLAGAVHISLVQGELLWFAVYFAVIPRLTGGRTPGHAVLKLRVVGMDGAPPKLWQLLARYGLLYFVEPLFVFGAAFAALALALTGVSQSLSLTARAVFGGLCLLGLGAFLWFPLRCWNRWGSFPHGHYSRTAVVQAGGSRQKDSFYEENVS